MWAALVFVVLGVPRGAQPCDFAYSGFVDPSLEGSRPILRAGVEAPTLVSAVLVDPSDDDGSGCGGGDERCAAPYVQLVVEGEGFDLLVGEDVDTGETLYHRPVQNDGLRKRYSPLQPSMCRATLELAALYRDAQPAERSPPLRIRAEDVDGLTCD